MNTTPPPRPLLLARRAALLALLAPVAASGASLCRPAEQVVFSCTTQPGRTASLCLATDGLRYRYGRPGAIELTYPETAEPHPSMFRLTHYFRAGVDRSALEFETAEAVYEVYTDVEAPARREAGVRVTVKRTGRERTIACRGAVQAHWYRVEGRVACSDEPLNSCTPPASR